MSHFDYEQSRYISGQNFTFKALIMAAMRKADSRNAYLLENSFPDIWEELEERYLAPGGAIPTDPQITGKITDAEGNIIGRTERHD